MLIKQFTSQSTFNPLGVNDCNWYIHWVSFCEIACFKLVPLQCLSTQSLPQKIGLERSLLRNLLKWYDKLCLWNPFLILLMCSRSLTLSSLVVLPTYWRTHSHSKRYVMCVVPHVMNLGISYICPVVLD